MPDDAAWANHVVVPDDASELAADVEAYHRELRAARRARRWGWLTGSRVWQRWSFPLGMVAGALSLAALLFVLLAFESAPARPARLAATPLATPTYPPGVSGGLLPDTLLSSAPEGGSSTRQSALAVRPALVALMPQSCRCTDVVAALADQARGVGVALAVVAPGSRDAEVSALPGRVHGVQTWYDPTGALASAYAAHGVTVLVVDPDGVVSFVQRDVTASLARTLPVQSVLVLPPLVGRGLTAAGMRSRSTDLLLAAHPLPSAAVTAFAAATGAAAGLSAGRTALLAVAILVGQLSIGWANDYVDAARDRTVGRADKPLARSALPDGVVGIASAIALVADIPLSLALGTRPGAAHLVAVGSAWLYDAWLKPTVASVVPYAVSFGLLPVVIAGTLPGQPRPRLLIAIAGALMGVAAHFANTVGDTADDELTGVRGLPQRAGPAASLAIAAVLVAGAAGCLVAVTDAAMPALAAAAAAVVVLAVVAGVARRSGTGRGGSRRLAFRSLLLAVAGLIAAFVVSGGSRLT